MHLHTEDEKVGNCAQLIAGRFGICRSNPSPRRCQSGL